MAYPYYIPTTDPSKWITDKVMPLFHCEGLQASLGYTCDSERLKVRQHYIRARMGGYHMNQNNPPPFHWSKP